MIRRPYSRFLRWFAALLGIYLVIALTLTTAVDPWRINGAPWAIAALDPSRDIHPQMRIGKAALANRGTWQAVILGSSRLEIALDPSHPSFQGQRAVNLAMHGSSLYEAITVGNYTLDRNPHVKTLVLGIEPDDYHSDADGRTSNLLYESPFADNNRSLERSINQLIGANTLGQSIATLQRHFRSTPSRFSPLGQLLHPPDHGNLRRFIEAEFVENSANQWNQREQTLRTQKSEWIAQFVTRARQSGIAVFIVIPPQHALKQIHPTEDRPDRMAWESDLLALAAICTKANASPANAPPVELWSFQTFNPYTTTPMPGPDAPSQSMPGWFDLGHSDKSLGDRMLDTLLLDGASSRAISADPIGMNLLQHDWNTIRAAWIEAHRNYCARHPQDVAWWRGLLARSARKTQASR